MPRPPKGAESREERLERLAQYSRNRASDPSAKRLGTRQIPKAKPPAKKGIGAKVRGVAKTAAKTYVGLHTAPYRAALRGGKAVAGSEAAKSVGRQVLHRLKSSPYAKVGRAVGRGVKELATTRRQHIGPRPRRRRS